MTQRTTLPVNDATLLLGVGVVALLFVMIKGGIRSAAASAAGAVVDAAGGAVTGAVDVIGQGVGLPALSDMTTDPAVARWIIDAPNGGYYEASVWSSASALAHGWAMDAGSGQPPPRGSRIEALFPTSVTSSGVVGSW